MAQANLRRAWGFNLTPKISEK
uniref:Uncharacterized protein n=1 Tax=Arundo donax TaxID=35708 RepID=A0A0A9H3T0_ARUDO